MKMALRRSARSKDQAVQVSSALLSSQSRVKKSSTSSSTKKKSLDISVTTEPKSEAGLNAKKSVVPSTPKRKKARAIANGVDPSSGSIAVPYSSGDIDDSAVPIRAKRTRPAEPHHSNATLVSPQTSRIVSYSAEQKPSSLSYSTLLGEGGTTTADILDKAIAHLIRCDPSLKTVIDQNHCHVFSPNGLAELIDPFRSLTSGIISQQVSSVAGRSLDFSSNL